MTQMRPEISVCMCHKIRMTSKFVLYTFCDVRIMTVIQFCKKQNYGFKSVKIFLIGNIFYYSTIL